MKDIRRQTRGHFSAEGKIGHRVGWPAREDSIAELCRRESIAQSLYYTWSKEFMEAGKSRLAGEVRVPPSRIDGPWDGELWAVMLDTKRTFDELVTRHAWGNTWQRDGIDLRTRSIVTVSMLVALGRMHELKIHVRGALNNGVTPAELQEIFLHASVYCGFPAAVDAFRNAAEVIDSA